MFLLFTFLITFSMGIIMFLVYKYISRNNVSAFAIAQMLYPALVSIGIKIYYEREYISKGLMSFFKFYIIFVILSILILIIGVFTFQSYLLTVLNILLIIVSIAAVILMTNNDNGYLKKINMNLKKNFKNTLLLSLSFIALNLITNVFSGLVYGTLSEVLKNTTINMILTVIMIPLALIFSFVIFFGEEFGWRYYLQPRLQVLFGKKLGVIILGFIWGIWHFPLCFMLYSPETPIQCVIFHIFYCVLLGIFLGFVYMKTENLWSVIIIHLINNYVAVGATNSYEIVITSKDLILSLIIHFIIFMPFLFTKEYKGHLTIEEFKDSI